MNRQEGRMSATQMQKVPLYPVTPKLLVTLNCLPRLSLTLY